MKNIDFDYIRESATDAAFAFAPIWLFAGLILSAVNALTIKTAIYAHFFKGSAIALVEAKANWLASLSGGETFLLYLGGILGVILVIAITLGILFGLFWLGAFICGYIDEKRR